MPKNIYKNANSVIEGNYDNTSLGSNTYLLGLTSLFDEIGLQGIQYQMFYLAQIFRQIR
ncbi:araC family transcriptional regulator domain protein [Acinetobacter baumannii 573719]|jgi:hypothetical protein|nr:araC family transcriptional regulator domain protein [Acinetobacter baumannii 573719]